MARGSGTERERSFGGLGWWRSGSTRTRRAAPRRAVLELCQCAPPSTPSPVPTTVAAFSVQYSLTFPRRIKSRLIINIQRSMNVNCKQHYLCTLTIHKSSQVITLVSERTTPLSTRLFDQYRTVRNIHSTLHFYITITVQFI